MECQTFPRKKNQFSRIFLETFEGFKKILFLCIFSLATIHATAYAYQTALGGRAQFLSRFPLIKEDIMPKAKQMR